MLRTTTLHVIVIMQVLVHFSALLLRFCCLLLPDTGCVQLRPHIYVHVGKYGAQSVNYSPKDIRNYYYSSFCFMFLAPGLIYEQRHPPPAFILATEAATSHTPPSVEEAPFQNTYISWKE